MLTVSTQCAPEGTRTPNLLIRSQMLYPLSYGRMLFALAHNVVKNTSRSGSARIEGGCRDPGRVRRSACASCAVESPQLALQCDAPVRGVDELGEESPVAGIHVHPQREPA